MLMVVVMTAVVVVMVQRDGDCDVHDVQYDGGGSDDDETYNGETELPT